MAKEYPKRMYLYVDGDYENAKEAKDAKEVEKLTRKGYVERPQPTEFPKIVYKADNGKRIKKTVKDATEEAAAIKAGFGKLPDSGALESSARREEKKGKAKTDPE